MTQPPSHNPCCEPARLERKARRGDADTVEHLAICYGDSLKAVGLARCRTCADADDAVQDALLSAQENLHQYQGQGSLHGWLATLVANACHRRTRGRKNDPSLHTDTLPSLQAQNNPEQKALEHELWAQLETALNTLPSEHRQLFLAALQGGSTRVLAERFHLTQGAVRTRLTRIRQQLRAHLP